MNTESRRPIQLLFRSKEAVELFTLNNTSATAPKSPVTKGGREIYRGKTSFHILNPNGERVYIHDPSIGLLAADINSTDVHVPTAPFLPDSQAIQLAKCSPRGSYLLTWQRPVKTPDGNDANLKIWDAQKGSILKAFHCKKATLDTLQWTYDESLLFHMVTNEIHIYNNEWKQVAKVRSKDVASFSLPTSKGLPKNIAPSIHNEQPTKYLFTTFSPSIKGKPSRVDLLRYPDKMGRDSSYSTIDTSTNIPSGPSLTSKSLFSAEEVQVHWSPRADAALLLTQTAVDSTGQSYYGSTHLFLLLETDVKNPTVGLAMNVPTPPEASKDANGVVPIVSANWFPNPNVSGSVPFGVISGKMPAVSSLHHGQSGEPMFLLGKSHRNHMDISPHGRFLVLGGYGNLAGGMDFWDRNKEKMIPRHVIVSDNNVDGSYVTMKEPNDLTLTSCSPVVGHEWAPDSRTYLVCTTSPRMNVENGVHIYRYDGSLIDEKELPWSNEGYRPDKLLSAQYVPAPLVGDGSVVEPGREFYYPDRPQSPPPRGMVELKGEAANNVLAGLRQKSVASKQSAGARAGGGEGAYVPPGARKGNAARRGGGTSLAERMRQEREGSAAATMGKKVTKKTGLVGASSVGPVGSAPAEDAKSKNAIRREKQRLAKEKAEKEAIEAEQRKKEEEAARVEANKNDPEKRAKKLKKTLKQIDEIKAKAADGIELNEDQKKKLESEDDLRTALLDYDNDKGSATSANTMWQPTHTCYSPA